MRRSTLQGRVQRLFWSMWRPLATALFVAVVCAPGLVLTAFFPAIHGLILLAFLSVWGMGLAWYVFDVNAPPDGIIQQRRSRRTVRLDRLDDL